jgi:hypothetical protein
MLDTAVSSNQLHANLRCTKLVSWSQFLFYITCCIGKTLNITYSESVFIALGIQHDWHSGFKQSASCKFTFQENGCLELVPLIYNLLHWKNTKYYIFWECTYSLRYPTCLTQRFQATSFMQLYVARNWLLGTSSSFI